MKFCGQCGESLQISCAKCQFENPSGFNYCGNCGSQLAPSDELRKEDLPSRSNEKVHIEAERRHLTVMFCDLEGSTELSSKLDPEELREVVREYQEVCAKVVNRFEGHIAQYLGDGILVYFGYPVTHENEAYRAVNSGLRIIEAIKHLSERFSAEKNISISVRLGIHTGHVVIGDMGGGGKTEQLALGITPNIAARLEGIASSNSLVISADTYKLVERFFTCDEDGYHELKGISEPLLVYKVKHENIAKSRLGPEQNVDRLPLIGRAEEFNKVMNLWEKAKAGVSHVILLGGEAGMGKSHLLQAIISKIAEETDAWLNIHYCSPYHKNTAFYPLIDILENVVLQLGPDESENDKIDKIEGFLVQYGFDLAEIVPIFAQLLSVSLDSSEYKPTSFTPDQQKQKLIDAFLTVQLARAKEQPVLLVFEDLQFADSSTIELINQTINQEPTSKLLTFLSFRQEFTPEWGMQPHLIPITLSNLPTKDIEKIVTEIAEQKQLPQVVMDEIIKKTDGVPLFVEELTKMVLESSMVKEVDDHYELQGPVTALAIPSTLHDSLVARLDRMSAIKELAQIGATIGREFSFSLIKEVAAMDENEIQEGLTKLVKAELLYQKGVPPSATYQFKHALIQDAAAQTLLKKQKQNFHGQIAHTLASKFPELVDRKPQMLASHYQGASMMEEAVDHWIKAGKKASEHSAYDEALSYLAKGYELLEKVSDLEKQKHLELDLLSVQSPIYVMTEGFTSKNAFESYSRMEEVAKQTEDRFLLFLSYRGVTLYHLFTGKLPDAKKYAQLGIDLADKFLGTEMSLEAKRLFGQVCIYTGEFELSLDSFDKALSQYKPEEHNSLTRLTGADPGIFSLAQSSHVLWYLGYPEQAEERVNRAMSKANKLELRYSQALAGFLGALIALLKGDLEETKRRANTCISLCEKYGIKMFESEAKNFIGWYLVQQGEFAEGIALIKSSIAWRKKMEIKTSTNIHLCILIGIYLEQNKIKEGLEIVEEALDFAAKSGDQLCLTEVHRLNGELLLAKKDKKLWTEIDKSFEKSIELARQQNAKSFELRAAISKARFLHKQEKIDDAIELLDPVYSWFTEGFGSKDLKEARELLDELTNIKKSVANSR